MISKNYELYIQKIPCLCVHSDKEKNLGTTYFKTKVTVF